MTLTLTNLQGSFDITELVSMVQWSGGCSQCARTLAVGLLAKGAPDCANGCQLRMSEGGQVLFAGIVLSRTRSTASPIIDLTAFDFGVYLKQNQTSKKFVKMTAEAATAALCAEFGIAVGVLAVTGVGVSRKFFGKSLYEIIMSLYTEAAKVTGKRYFVRFVGTALSVLEKGAAESVLVIRSGGNLIDASTTEDAQAIINRVAVYDQNQNPLSVQADAASAALYGVMQQVLMQREGEDVAAQVTTLLKGAMPRQQISVNGLGDCSCVSGGSVMLQESVTGLCGRFFIDGDTHQWKNGVYTNQLMLNLEAVMDEQSAGEALEGEQKQKGGG